MSEVYELKGDTKDLTFKTALKTRTRHVVYGGRKDPFKYCTACHAVCKRGYPFWHFFDGCGHCGHKSHNHFYGEGEAP